MQQITVYVTLPAFFSLFFPSPALTLTLIHSLSHSHSHSPTLQLTSPLCCCLPHSPTRSCAHCDSGPSNGRFACGDTSLSKVRLPLWGSHLSGVLQLQDPKRLHVHHTPAKTASHPRCTPLCIHAWYPLPAAMRHSARWNRTPPANESQRGEMEFSRVDEPCLAGSWRANPV